MSMVICKKDYKQFKAGKRYQCVGVMAGYQINSKQTEDFYSTDIKNIVVVLDKDFKEHFEL